MLIQFKAAVIEVFAKPAQGKTIAVTQALLDAKTEKTRNRVQETITREDTQFILHLYYNQQHAQVNCEPRCARSLIALLHRLRLQNPNGVLGCHLTATLIGAFLPEPAKPDTVRTHVYEHAPHTGVPTLQLEVRIAHVSTEQANWLAYQLEQQHAQN